MLAEKERGPRIAWRRPPEYERPTHQGKPTDHRMVVLPKQSMMVYGRGTPEVIERLHGGSRDGGSKSQRLNLDHGSPEAASIVAASDPAM
jgi:hypothetical protein